MRLAFVSITIPLAASPFGHSSAWLWFLIAGIAILASAILILPLLLKKNRKRNTEA